MLFISCVLRKNASDMLTVENAEDPAGSSGAIFFDHSYVMLVASVEFWPTTVRL